MPKPRPMLYWRRKQHKAIILDLSQLSNSWRSCRTSSRPTSGYLVHLLHSCPYLLQLAWLSLPSFLRSPFPYSLFSSLVCLPYPPYHPSYCPSFAINSDLAFVCACNPLWLSWQHQDWTSVLLSLLRSFLCWQSCNAPEEQVFSKYTTHKPSFFWFDQPTLRTPCSLELWLKAWQY